MHEKVPQPGQAKISGGISAVIPALNEEQNIRAVVSEAATALSGFANEFEIIVVDDGSSDQTPELVSESAKADPRVRLVRHDRNRGYGAALSSGFEAARLKYIFFTDGDRQFKLSELDRLVPRLAESPMVIGFRELRQDPWLRRMYGRMFSGMVNLLFGLEIKDMNCAFKIFERDIIAGREFRSRGALINAELLALAKSRGVAPVQVPVSHFPRKAGSQTGGSARVILRAARELLDLYFHRP